MDGFSGGAVLEGAGSQLGLGLWVVYEISDVEKI